MKELHCPHCNTLLITIVEGRIKKGTVALCPVCWNVYKSARNLQKTSPKMDLPEGFEALFGRFK